MKVTNISHLKKHLSASLKAVRAGEELLVTDRNVPVAIIESLPAGLSQGDSAELIAAGVMSPRLRKLDLRQWHAMPRGTWQSGLSEAIEEERAGR